MARPRVESGFPSQEEPLSLTVRSFLAELSPIWLRRRIGRRPGTMPIPARPEEIIRARTIIPVAPLAAEGPETMPADIPGARPPRPAHKM